MRRDRGFTLTELLIGIGIIAALVGLLVPALAAVRETAVRTACASNLRQVGAALHVYYGEYHRLPVRAPGLDQMNPHVLRYKRQTGDIADAMERFAGGREVFYCPANFQQRTPEQWWPYHTGTVAATYQFPFWLKASLWTGAYPDYRRLTPDRLLAADYLGAEKGPTKPLAWNHKLAKDGGPVGMNELFGDGHVQWADRTGGWILYAKSGGPIDWYYAASGMPEEYRSGRSHDESD